jgi:hypothetical protein
MASRRVSRSRACATPASGGRSSQRTARIGDSSHGKFQHHGRCVGVDDFRGSCDNVDWCPHRLHALPAAVRPARPARCVAEACGYAWFKPRHSPRIEQ